MGIPIDGHVDDFRKILEKKGFTYDEIVDTVCFFNGNFAGDESTVLVIFDDKTNNVYAVSVAIECSSEKSVKEKYRQYVRDLTNEYHAKEVSEIIDSYKDTPEKFYSDLKKGKFKEFNILIPDSAKNITDIMISKIELDNESAIISSPLESCVKSLFEKYSGNVGMISVNYEYDDEDDVYDLNILYYDTQNAKALMDN